MKRVLAAAIPAALIFACDSGRPIDEVAGEVLWVRLIGFIIVLAIAFGFFIRNFRKK